MSTPVATPVHRQLSVRLQREWDHLSRRSAVVERARSWQVTEMPFHSLDDLLGLAGFKVPHSPAADETLRRLVVVAGAGDALAARVVLQRLLPGLLAIVRREQQVDRRTNAFDLLVGEAWLAIVTYRADRRRTDVAARLLNDARHRAFTTPRRKQDRAPEDLVAPARLDLPRLPRPGSSFEELAIVLGEARRNGLADGDLAIIRDYLGAPSTVEADGGRTVSERTLRNHRRRIVGKIRRLAA